MLPIASILLYAGPQSAATDLALSNAGWFYCDGRFLDPNVYQDLYLRIGQTFTHPGNFAVPDLRVHSDGIWPEGHALKSHGIRISWGKGRQTH